MFDHAITPTYVHCRACTVQHFQGWTQLYTGLRSTLEIMSIAASFQCTCARIKESSAVQIYKNHAMIGKAIRDSGVPREEVFVTSKVSPYEQGAEKAPKAARQFLEELGMR
jgi:hypothetical protein